MTEVVHTLTGPQIVAIVAILSVFVFLIATSLAGIIAPHWRRAKQIEAETQLKREMLASGHSVDEIERVVKVTSSVGVRGDARVKV